MTNLLSRRNFLKAAGVAAGTGLGAAAVARPMWAAETGTNPSGHPRSVHQQGGHGDADAIDAAHEEGVQIFLDNIGKDELFWNNKLDYRLEDGVKVFELTCQETEWEVEPGRPIQAMAFNGTVPGPEIRITEGDRVRIIVHNEMSQSTGIHWHGVKVPNNMDGVPYITQPPIKPGESFTYEFEAKNPGSHMYHSHHNAMEQVTRGLLGAFIIERKDPAKDP